MYLFYNKNNFEILNMVKPNDTQFDIDSFIDSRLLYDDKYKNLSISDVDYILEDSSEYDYVISSKLDYKMYINPEIKKLEIKIIPLNNLDNKYLTYNCQEFKRNFSIDDIKEMYYEDYINFNLRNIVKNNVFKVQFEYIKDLNIRSSIADARWDSFFTDPFLKEMGEDKLKLGRDIIKNGTYYPLFICTSEEDNFNMHVVEGNHRIMSLKLLQMIGEIPDDFKVLCIHIPGNNFDYKNKLLLNLSSKTIGTRHIFETEYGSSVVNDEYILKKSKESVLSKQGKFINDYTIEYNTNNLDEIMFGIHSYPLWVRDLIHPVSEIIKPSIIINNQETFVKWREEE